MMKIDPTIEGIIYRCTEIHDCKYVYHDSHEIIITRGKGSLSNLNSCVLSWTVMAQLYTAA